MPGMRCKICWDAEPIIKLESYRLALCVDCFDDFVMRRVKRGIRSYQMFGHRERVLVAVSGGKDSLALWDLLVRQGYQADGLYIDLGIGTYSAESRRLAEAFAAQRGLRLHVQDVPGEMGMGIPEIARQTRRKPCSVCGTLKRHLMNRVSWEGQYDVLATGHNLDDEVTTLFSNVLRWQVDYLGRQHPNLPATEGGLKRKVKPLIYLGEQEMAAYCMLKGIPYIYEECPLSSGATSLFVKDVLNQIERRSRGTKLEFFKGFLDQRERFRLPEERVELHPCARCGSPTTAGVCAVCRLKARLAGEVIPAGDDE